MLKVVSKDYLKDMGFISKNNSDDYVCIKTTDDGLRKVIFKIYTGSLYLRYSSSTYSANAQLKCIYEWTKKGYIEWED